MNKILILTPTPTHPPVAGNRAAIIALANELMSAGKEVHCLYIPLENYDQQAMFDFFKGRFYTMDQEYLAKPLPKHRYYIKRVFQKLKGLKLWYMQKTGNARAEAYAYNQQLDQNLSYKAKRFTRKFAREHSFDAVICEYVWLSKLLTYFPSTTYKVIDTHDRFSNRYLVYKKMGRKPEWDSLYPDGEAKGLKRADLLLALNQDEQAYFEQLSGVKTLVRLPVTLNQPIEKRVFKNRLLYFGSDNIINLTSLTAFINGSFPVIQKVNPEIELYVGGKICNVLKIESPQVVLKGIYDDPATFYRLGDIVINPEIEGTGFKIKTFEALSYGMPVVCTRAGAVGMIDKVNEHLVLVNDGEEFAEAIGKLCRDELFRNALSVKAYRWAKDAVGKNSQALLAYLK